jgi:hypothetical protein
MFYSSVRYAGVWSLVGLIVLAAGLPLLLIAKPREPTTRGAASNRSWQRGN